MVQFLTAANNPGGEQAAPAGVRQADGLLSPVGAHARRHPRGAADLHAARPRRVQAALGRRLARGPFHRLRRAASAGRARPGVYHRPRFRGQRQRGAGPGRQHLLRPGLPADSPGRRRPAHRGHRLRLLGQGPRALRRGRAGPLGKTFVAGREAQAAPVELRRDRPVLLRQPRAGRRRGASAVGPGRAGNHRRQPRLPRLGRVGRRDPGPRVRLARHGHARVPAPGGQLRGDDRARQGLKIACLEEIALSKGFITRQQFQKLADEQDSSYGQYLRDLFARTAGSGR